jgi:hypothetical protein
MEPNMKTTKISKDLLTLADVCAYYDKSESTIRRHVKASREGTSNFPLPLFKSGSIYLKMNFQIHPEKNSMLFIRQ